MNGRNDTRLLRFRISIQGMIVTILIMSLTPAWYWAETRLEIATLAHDRMERFAIAESARHRNQLANERVVRKKTQDRPFWHAGPDWLDMTCLKIEGRANAFHRASFRNSDLKGAPSKGGDSSFQFANFDLAVLTNANLIGGASSFQEASFDAASLTDRQVPEVPDLSRGRHSYPRI